MKGMVLIMKKLKEELKYGKRGITLISLVVTIIVLLILAGVTIATLTGENGILTRAQESKNTTENAKDDELRRLTVLEAATNLENQLYTDKNGDTATIPAGFAVSQVEGENIIEEGLVIIDSKGNEYVWIPIFEKDDKNDWGIDYDSYNITISKDSDQESFIEDEFLKLEKAFKDYTSTFANENYKDEWFGTEENMYGYYKDGNICYYSNGNLTEDEYNNLYKQTLISMYKNGGFYVGRYEMGIDVVNSESEATSITRSAMTEYISTSNNENNNAPSIENMTQPISRANAVQYTCITQSQAQILAESLNYNSVNSTIMFGVQRDIVYVFLEKYGKTVNGQQFDETYLTTELSNLWGNYYNAEFTLDRGFFIYMDRNTNDYIGNWIKNDNKTKEKTEILICTTGASEKNKALNIYDFSGNLYENTLEKANNTTSPVTSRKGNCGWDDYASHRSQSYTYSSSKIVTSRVALNIL